MPFQHTNIENSDQFVVVVEAIFVQFRGIIPSALADTALSYQIRQEPTITGLVLDISENEEGWDTLLIETADEVNGVINRMRVA